MVLGMPIPQPRGNCAGPRREERAGSGRKNEDKGEVNPGGTEA